MADDSVAVVEQPKKGFSGKDYNHVAVNAKLRLISLLSSTFDVKPRSLPKQDDWKLAYEWNAKGCTFDGRGVVSAIFEYVVTAKLGRKTALKCTAEYVVLYEVPSESEAEAAEGFCHNVGLFAAYPYFRGLVAQLVSNANLMLPPLPSIASTAHIPKKADAQETGTK
jgi:preprotein translocase subunit SecB